MTESLWIVQNARLKKSFPPTKTTGASVLLCCVLFMSVNFFLFRQVHNFSQWDMLAVTGYWIHMSLSNFLQWLRMVNDV